MLTAVFLQQLHAQKQEILAFKGNECEMFRAKRKNEIFTTNSDLISNPYFFTNVIGSF